ncbi:chemotaxis protein methyltransferase CheR [Caldimonas brevitalea]|uniref:histidine kinase n=2 Tax=Caldimonas brevitalea TaxID=413882 RepID=A0A0G3BCW8_9BURK|nr:chemotaxis protein methyltransferase CheR [Caldimonas brevitalea]
MTLGRRLLLLILAVLLPTACLFVWIVVATYQREAESAHQRLRETARALSLVVDRELDKRAAVARTLAASAAILEDDLARFYGEAKAASEGSGNWVVLIDAERQRLNTSVALGTPLPRHNAPPGRPLVTGRPEVSNLRIGPVSQRPVLGVFAPDRSGTPPRYNVGLIFTPDALQAIITQQRLPAGWIAAVMDKGNTVVAREPDPQRWIGKRAQPDLIAALQTRSEGFIESVSLDGIRVLAFYSRSPVYGWTFVIGVPQDILTTGARHAAWQAAASAAFLAVLSVVLALRAARGIRRPIQALGRAARELANDEVPAAERTGLVEVDAVSAALHRAGLQAAAINDELEHRAATAVAEAQEAQEQAARLQQRLLAEELLPLIIDNLPVLISYVDAEGVYRLNNRAYERWFGEPRSNITGRHVRDVAGEAAWQTLRPYMEAALAGQAVSCEHQIAYPRAGKRWVAITYVPHLTAAGSVLGVAILVHDITAHREALDELRRAEERLTQAVRAAGVGVFDHDHVSGELHWSPVIRAIHDWPPDRPPQLDSVLARVHPDDREAHLAALRSAHDPNGNGVFASDYRVLRADGKTRWISARAQTFFKGEGAARRAIRTVGAELDVTDRKRIEEALQRSDESHRLIVALHDATRELRDPALVQREVVARVGRYFGVSRCAYAEIDPSQQFALVLQDHTDGVPSVVGRHRLNDFGPRMVAQLRAGSTVVIEDVASDERLLGSGAQAAFAGLHARAGVGVPLVKDRRLVALMVLQHREPRTWRSDEVALIEQVAERTWFAVESARAEAALRESRDVLALAMRGGRMGAWSRDLVTDRVWWSAELEELFGLPPGGFSGTTEGFRSLVHPDERPALEAAVAQALERRDDYCVQFRFRHASGQWRWMEGRGRAVYATDGRPTMLYGLGIDITERMRSEEELRRLYRELSDADRRKDEFLATLAHELRNPLAPIRNALEILRLKAPPDPETRWSRDVIDRQARHLTRLVDDLLDIARITRGKIELQQERVELTTIVQGALEAAQPLVQACGHQLTVSLPPQPVWLEADVTRLTQVFLNLLNNAAKYTPHGGQIWLTAEADDAMATVAIRDTGVGIAAEHLETVFEMFSQVDPVLERAQGGLGIGLALARGLVALHGGSIRAHSAGPGRGSEFVVRLPRSRGTTSQAAADEAPAVAPRSAPQRILVVDDNRDAAESLAVLLRLGGRDVALAHDGEAALQEVRRYAPDVVLLDIGMPGMSGYEVARRIRSRPRGQQVCLVALTGWGQEDDKQRALAAGFDAHLTKPVDAQTLEATLVGAATR